VNSLYAVYDKAHEGFAERYLEMLAAGGTSIIPSCSSRSGSMRAIPPSGSAGWPCWSGYRASWRGCDHVQCIKIIIAIFTFYIPYNAV